jgi:predicted enzyme related to lactoylglutathione lyase
MWFDLNAADTDQARGFYGDLFGWATLATVRPVSRC